jgi:hypothetical protein
MPSVIGLPLIVLPKVFRVISQTTRIVEAVAYRSVKTKHAGAKNGGGAWMTRAEAKEAAKRKRRELYKRDAADALLDAQPGR